MSQEKSKGALVAGAVVIVLLVLAGIAGWWLWQRSNVVAEVIEEPEAEIQPPEAPAEPEDARVLALEAEKYFLKRNLERYLAYQETHPDLSWTVIVRDVNSNLDKTKYVDVEPADLSHDYLSMINKYNYLGEYEPEDLVELGADYGSGHNRLRKVAAEAFWQMADAARTEGIILRNISGFRSYAVQAGLYANYSARDGAAQADTYSSRAGYSEHQAGLATDINSVDTDFQYTKEFAWLAEHAADYGFILRYPEGLEEITGFSYEPWHYRYVGVEAAQQIKAEDVTFDEYYAYYVIGDTE